MYSVSVIIVNWNSGELLKKCLEKLMHQTIKPERVFVVDNASTDASIGDLDLPENVTLLQMEANVGFAAGNNQALPLCSTDYVALLNPDAFPEPDWLENLIVAAENFPNIAVFGSRQLCADNPQIVDGVGDVYHISGLAWRKGYSQKISDEQLKSEAIFSSCAAAALYRRSVLDDAGGFDEDYFCYMEDVDLGFRLRLAGYGAMYVPEAVVHHVGSASTGGQHSDFGVYHGHRNLVWTFVKNMPGILFWLLLPLHLLLNVVTIIVFSARGQGKVIWRAKIDAIKGLPKMWAKRRQIQKQRVASIGDIWRVLDKSWIRK
ncbi:glycosyltransferase family 2 protein [Methylomarinum sp. Ch1-1]|uniref:Glycosyltransferase family 2 protein n=1 Tax=Methylomarinum roseum TaxID=3067653 RepID=A0AAU7NVM6_9GAMM